MITALRHQAAARNWRAVGELLPAHYVRLVTRGQAPALARSLQDIPWPVLDADPVLAAATLGSRLCSGDFTLTGPDGGSASRGDRSGFVLSMESGHDPFVRLVVGSAAAARTRRRGRFGDMFAHLDALTDLIPHAGRRGVHWRVVIEEHRGAAATWAGEHSPARRHLLAAIGSADEVGPTLPSVGAAALMSLIDALDGRLSAAVEGGRQSLIRHLLAMRTIPSNDPLGAVEPARVTQREWDVLVLLPTGLTGAEIATRLHISVNTVKSHQHSLYRKLGVSNRREAVEHAERAVVR